ncbi:alpha-amylase family glycosyl hydrolase [Schleiferiaceae bacterium]|nr:alpha-amylase family glycosyl hydrolase [Schleiferiaceae bacterium]
MKKSALITVFLTTLLVASFSVKGQTVQRMDPPNWWIDHPLDTVEILLQGEGLLKWAAQVEKPVGKVLQTTHYGDRYSLVKLWIRSGFNEDGFNITLGSKDFFFPLLERSGHQPQGLSDQDLVYLITPDRFHNGDPSNDDVPGMRERGVDRSEPYARHGGDLEGVQMGLNYIESLGATALWLNPVLENDMMRDSYHGYAITDHYRVDPRYGGDDALRELATELHQREMKHIMDIVYNHWGVEHYLHRNLPDSGMVHFNPDGSIPYSNFRFSALADPHALAQDKQAFEHGWFAGAMPDLDQTHPLTASYLRYSTLWYIEMFEVDALRCDTYAFSDPLFLRKMNQLLKRLYPNIFIFGETWSYSEASQAYFAPNKMYEGHFSLNDAVTDFTLWRAIHKMYSAVEHEQFGWNTGAGELYYRLVSDYLYEHPEDLIIFLDNHDDGRFLGQFGQDTTKLKSALTLLYAMRGIPVLYYGTELGLSGHEDHGAIREDMPEFEGKFPDFDKIGGDLLDLCQELGASRKLRGRTSIRQAVPKDGWYVLWISSEQGTWRLVINASDERRTFTNEFEQEENEYEPWEAQIIELL